MDPISSSQLSSRIFLADLPLSTSLPSAGISGQLNHLKNSIPHNGFALSNVGFEQIDHIISILLTIKSLLLENPNPYTAKTLFQRANGFHILIQLARSLSGIFICDKFAHSSRQQIRDSTFQLLCVLIDILSYSLLNHPPNTLFFSTHPDLDSDGWNTLFLAFTHTGVFSDDSNPLTYSTHPLSRKLFGCILQAAISPPSDSISQLFQNLPNFDLYICPSPACFLRVSSPSEYLQPPLPIDLTLQPINHDKFCFTNDHFHPLCSHLAHKFPSFTPIIIPGFIKLYMELWKYAFYRQNIGPSAKLLSFSILYILKLLIEQSVRNSILVNQANLVSQFLPLILVKDSILTPDELIILEFLIRHSLTDGVVNISDVHSIFHQAFHSSHVAEFAYKAICDARFPTFIHFDLSLTGYSSIEFSHVTNQFPPHHGYSLTAWIRLEHYDPSFHTLIFGIKCGTRTIMTLGIDESRHNLILQFSPMFSPRITTRFRNTRFIIGLWYHIGLVHAPSNRGSLETVLISLYINGKLVEQLQCPQASRYPWVKRKSNFSGFKAFIGTPQYLSSCVTDKENFAKTSWSLASLHLFQVPLQPDIVSVCARLGPRYQGNFQDTLGTFLTYRAATKLSLQLDPKQARCHSRTDVLSVLSMDSSKLCNEHDILLGVLPSTIVTLDTISMLQKSGTLAHLSTNAQRTLMNYVVDNCQTVVLNSKFSSFNRALTTSRGFGFFTGMSTVNQYCSFDDAVWCVGGCVSIGIGLLHQASNFDDTILAVKITFALIKNSWRNCETMEREQGFRLFAFLIREKLGVSSSFKVSNENMEVPLISGTVPLVLSLAERSRLAIEILNLSLEHLGYNSENPSKSHVYSTMAYRTIILDNNMWFRISAPVQTAYFRQFISFLDENDYRKYNMKSFNKMKVSCELINAIKSEFLYQASCSDFLQTLKILIRNNFTRETLRTLVYTIAFTLYKKARRRSTVTGVSLSVHHKFPNPHDRDSVYSHYELVIDVIKILTELVCESSYNVLNRMFTAVNVKWLLYFVKKNDSRVVVNSLAMLTRVLVVKGNEAVRTFSETISGFIVLRAWLKQWKDSAGVWLCIFCVFFGVDVAQVDLGAELTVELLCKYFLVDGEVTVRYPEAFDVIMGMLDAELNSIHDDDTEEFMVKSRSTNIQHKSQCKYKASGSQSHSVVWTIVDFLGELHEKSWKFQEFCHTSSFLSDLFSILYPVTVDSEKISAEAELDFRASSSLLPTNQIGDICSSKTSCNELDSTTAYSIEPSISRYRFTRCDSSYLLIGTSKSVNLEMEQYAQDNLSKIRSRVKFSLSLSSNVKIIDKIFYLATNVIEDQIFRSREFLGVRVLHLLPPGQYEQRAYFATHVLQSVILSIQERIHRNGELLGMTRVIVNLARFVARTADGIFEGWLLDYDNCLLDLTGIILDIMRQTSDGEVAKNVKQCASAVASLRAVFLRICMARLVELRELVDERRQLEILRKLLYWQTVILGPDNAEDQYMKLINHILHINLLESNYVKVKIAIIEMIRMFTIQKGETSRQMWSYSRNILGGGESNAVAEGFMRITELDNETFLGWVNEKQDVVKRVIAAAMSKKCEDYARAESQRTEQTARIWENRRRAQLRVLVEEEKKKQRALHNMEVETATWYDTVYDLELNSLQRTLQDQHYSLEETGMMLEALVRGLNEPLGITKEKEVRKWRLDECEGRDRIRLRLLPVTYTKRREYLPKQGSIEGNLVGIMNELQEPSQAIEGWTRLALGEKKEISTTEVGERERCEIATSGEENDEEFEIVQKGKDMEGLLEDKVKRVWKSLEEGDRIRHVSNVAHIIELDVREGLLVLGDKTLYLMNDYFQRRDGEIVSIWLAPEEERDDYIRIINSGLTGRVEWGGIQRRNRLRWAWGNILSVVRRQFLHRDVGVEIFLKDGRSHLLALQSQGEREELLSQIKIGMGSVEGGWVGGGRNGEKNEGFEGEDEGEESWRLNSLGHEIDRKQSFGNKIVSVFNNGSQFSEATRRWVRGKISNYGYLMIVNTMAGRTFNDLSQYPIFPWVLADYSSEELDLEDERTFRDLSKPMGCQNAEREAEFRRRYQMLQEMNDEGERAFHYGTHYSSAMIVASYLIRLEPFVQAYMILQGGKFDHADRIFHSIEKVWRSASKENMTDVRELIPEFYSVPEFLTNINGYDFGVTQGGHKRIWNVELPRWAKGDPEIFIRKHREALECDYVSRRLHLWIDLIFGVKQRGEAAVEATNLFHHLSYGGEQIEQLEDSMERKAAIGIAYNFGQTPRQIFTRAHPAKEMRKRMGMIYEGRKGRGGLTSRGCGIGGSRGVKGKGIKVLNITGKLVVQDEEGGGEGGRGERVDLIQVRGGNKEGRRILKWTGQLIEIEGRYGDRRREKLIVEWGFMDNGIRIWQGNRQRMIGKFEQLHLGQISTVNWLKVWGGGMIATGGMDGVIGLWRIVTREDGGEKGGKRERQVNSIDVWSESDKCSKASLAEEEGEREIGDTSRIGLMNMGYLFGHRMKVVKIAGGWGSMGTLVSLSEGAEMIMWDIRAKEENRCIRKIYVSESEEESERGEEEDMENGRDGCFRKGGGVVMSERWGNIFVWKINGSIRGYGINGEKRGKNGVGCKCMKNEDRRKKKRERIYTCLVYERKGEEEEEGEEERSGSNSEYGMMYDEQHYFKVKRMIEQGEVIMTGHARGQVKLWGMMRCEKGICWVIREIGRLITTSSSTMTTGTGTTMATTTMTTATMTTKATTTMAMSMAMTMTMTEKATSSHPKQNGDKAKKEHRLHQSGKRDEQILPDGYKAERNQQEQLADPFVPFSSSGVDRTAICSILLSKTGNVYGGDGVGRVYEWRGV